MKLFPIVFIYKYNDLVLFLRIFKHKLYVFGQKRVKIALYNILMKQSEKILITDDASIKNRVKILEVLPLR
jgi:hypothetical protein